jgi:hypothetical protein
MLKQLALSPIFRISYTLASGQAIHFDYFWQTGIRSFSF